MQENVRVSQGFPVTQPFQASPNGGGGTPQGVPERGCCMVLAIAGNQIRRKIPSQAPAVTAPPKGEP